MADVLTTEEFEAQIVGVRCGHGHAAGRAHETIRRHDATLRAEVGVQYAHRVNAERAHSEAVAVLGKVLNATVSCGEYVIRPYFDDQVLLAHADAVLGGKVAPCAECERFKDEKRLVQQWLKNMPDTKDVEQARKNALLVADEIARLEGKSVEEVRAAFSAPAATAEAEAMRQITEVEGVYRLSEDRCHESIEDGNYGDDVARRLIPDGVELGEPGQAGPRMRFRIEVTATKVEVRR
jgi:hypothetical protein